MHLEGNYVEIHSKAWFDQETEAHSWEVKNAGFAGVLKSYIENAQSCIAGFKEGVICDYR